jgi:hypothetical protein
VIKMTGGGSIDGHLESFGFDVENAGNGSGSGHLNYQDRNGAGFHMTSDSVTCFNNPPGTNQVNFSGTGTVDDGSAVTFSVTTVDNGEPGTNDSFGIVVTGSRTASHCGNLSQGNIKAHR